MAGPVLGPNPPSSPGRLFLGASDVGYLVLLVGLDVGRSTSPVPLLVEPIPMSPNHYQKPSPPDDSLSMAVIVLGFAVWLACYVFG